MLAGLITRIAKLFLYGTKNSNDSGRQEIPRAKVFRYGSGSKSSSYKDVECPLLISRWYKCRDYVSYSIPSYSIRIPYVSLGFLQCGKVALNFKKL